MDNKIDKICELINKSNKTTVLTGAGISVESGIPAFRGKKSFWDNYNPKMLSVDHFYKNPEESWSVLEKIYEKVIEADPNETHKILADMESENLIQHIITQNIDGLHNKAGSKNVIEFHGAANRFECLHCNIYYNFDEKEDFELPMRCSHCGNLLKPEIVFFGEGIPQPEYGLSIQTVVDSSLIIIIGTSGEVTPFNKLPEYAKDTGAQIVEINLTKTHYTDEIADISIQAKSTDVLRKIYNKIKES